MQYLESLFDTVQSIELNGITFLKDIGLACAVLLILGLLGRMIFGKRSNLNHAISSAFGILSVYILGVFLYGTSYVLSGLLASLPFVAVRDGMLALFSFTSASTPEICAMLVRMIVLAFLVNLLDTVLPKGKNLFSWLLFRLITVFLAVLCQSLIVWLSETYLPATFIHYAPIVLLAILAAMLLLGALKIFVGIALATVNPIIGALYTFFFSSLVGKQLSKAVLTTILLSLLVHGLNYLGYTLISLAGISVMMLLPVIIVLLLLWYLVNQVL